MLEPRRVTATSLPAREKYHELLVACIRAGMTYPDAKAICEKEYGEWLERTEKWEREEWDRYHKESAIFENYLVEKYERKKGY